MKTIESEFSKHIVKSEQMPLGDIHFFNHIAIIEFKEGVHVDIYNVSGIYKELLSFYGISRPFGIIANRVNSYSINLLDISSFKKIMKNLCAYSVVSHNLASAMNAKIESNFCSPENIHFEDINEAVNYVFSKVKTNVSISLN
ncbi:MULTISPECIES: hypothetical protein [unclassified Algibacter]|uniref:hypothetical protein n=1 Tax=unclassified Algibacter TaxID=2615009 RepID=UPI00131D280A|nr:MULTISPECIES: hypothetical protein [unclassified Algibacter]MCL5128404.1 hypothetical protein [Algibacter sp. L4_22]